jgi:hypothetical protein
MAEHDRLILDRRVWRAWQEFCCKDPICGSRAPEQTLQILMSAVMRARGHSHWVVDPPDPASMTFILEEQVGLQSVLGLTLSMLNGEAAPPGMDFSLESDGTED